MPATPLTLADALKALGKAVPLIGDWTTANGMTALGETEGPITETGGWNVNALTANEHTGGLAHQATVTPGAIAVTIPVILGDPDLYAKIMPTGSASGPADNPTPPVETGLWLVPLAVFPPPAGSATTARRGPRRGSKTTRCSRTACSSGAASSRRATLPTRSRTAARAS